MTNLGTYIAQVYEQYLEAYGDADLAAVATAATINDFLNALESEDSDPLTEEEGG